MSFRAIPSTVACILTLGLAALSAPAQSLIPRDGLATDGHLVAYDTARHRLVTLGRQGETRELDGTHWRLRPGTGPSMFGALAYRSAARRTLAFGAGYDRTAQTWEFDGVAWQQLSPSVQPTPRERFGCAYDIWRDRVVVFSGLSWTGTPVTDTWEWDGANWSQRATTGPAARQDAGMAFDAARGRCVLFGGQTGSVGQQGDTWEWDGTAWTQRVPATSPPPRSGAPLAYDAARARIVLHGGFALGPVVGVSDEVWEYDGNNWQLVGNGGPGAQMRHDLVYDPDRGAVLAVSNHNNGPSGGDYWSWDGSQWTRALTVPYQPTWGYGVRATAEPLSGGILAYGSSTRIFSGGVWTQVATAGAPPPRIQVGMWSDGASAWMFGGRDFFGPLFGDTLSWNGSAWVSANPAASPSPRCSPGIAYDSIAGRAVLFGGFGSSGTAPFGDTWLFDGTVWQPVVTLIAPTARGSHGLAFDPVRNCTVLFGGTGANNIARNDTWEWNGTAWSAISTARRPPAYGVAALAFDLRGNRTVATMAPFANLALPNFGEVWSYDGLDWTQVPLSEPSRLFQEHSLVAMPTSARLFAIDGTAALELVDAPPRTEVLGTPCTPAAPALVARALPEPGNQEFGIDVVQAPANGFVVLAGSLQSTTLPVGSCTLWLGAPLVAVVLAANAAGFVSQPIPVPPQSALVGGRLWFQAVTAPLVPPNSITLSAALQVEIGG